MAGYHSSRSISKTSSVCQEVSEHIFQGSGAKTVVVATENLLESRKSMSLRSRKAEIVICTILICGGVFWMAALAWKISSNSAESFLSMQTDTVQVREKSPVLKKVIDPKKSSTMNNADGSGSVSSKPANDYYSVVNKIKQQVLADTINPSSVQFCPKFEVITNKRGNSVYVGWYTSTDLLGVQGKDNIIAEVDASGEIINLKIGD